MNFKKFIPQINGDWNLLFKPNKFGNYVNDHSILKDCNGNWHLFGITSFTGIPNDEKYFVHGMSKQLITDEGMDEVGKVIDNGTRAWAPGVIRKDEKFYMFYGPSPTKLDISYDLKEWMGYEVKMFGVPELGCHRDHMVLKINDYTWVMYVSGVYKGYGCISCFASNDLINWRFVQYALTSSGNAPLTPAWGGFESPYVVKYGDLFYLFITYTDCKISNYKNTLVFCSPNPYDFGNYTGDNHEDIVISEISTHAGEILFEDKTQEYYITNCGWNKYNIPHEGAVSIAKLEWVESN